MKFIVILAVFFNSAGSISYVNIMPAVAGGNEAQRHSAPYIVSIQTRNEKTGEDAHYCGGAILNENWIITAAHCVPNDAIVDTFTIYAGCHDVRGNERTVQKRNVDYYVKHELYLGGVSPYDIALIYTEEPFKWTKAVRPINLPKTGTNHIGMAKVFGWGSTSTTLVPYFPFKLQSTEVPILDLALCQRILGGPYHSPLHMTNICTGPLTGGVSVCTSDSGGPLVQMNSKNIVELIGVVSWGRIPCGQPNSPSVYTQVSLFVDWIKKHMRQQPPLY